MSFKHMKAWGFGVALGWMLAGAASAGNLEAEMNKMSESTRDDLHLAISAGTAFLGEQWVASRKPEWNSVIAGTAIGMVPGVVKEVIDRSRGYEMRNSRHDMRTNLLGSVLGALVGYGAREKLGWSVFVIPQAQSGVVIGLQVPLGM